MQQHPGGGAERRSMRTTARLAPRFPPHHGRHRSALYQRRTACRPGAPRRRPLPMSPSTVTAAASGSVIVAHVGNHQSPDRQERFSGFPSRSNVVVQDSTVPIPDPTSAAGRFTVDQRRTSSHREIPESGGESAVYAEAVLGQIPAVRRDQADAPDCRGQSRSRCDQCVTCCCSKARPRT